ncbi:MAG: polymerase subunit gamma/tau [Actinomycetota bacterium]|jgi:DNA polymerase-3 subunit gamma/tau|nr:polymerase subunit gamma/tau [Actinomycetota bacterium]
MAHVSLYRKYRSQTFSEILGQEHVSTTLANAISEDRVAHAYLFTGPRGTGKTSMARILAKALNCVKGPTPEPCGVCDSCVAITEGSSLDVFEMDAASHSGVDDTREILAGVPLATAGGRKKVYVIDEVHMLTSQSFNALLKTLEEPPSHVVFVLATTEAHKVLPTIISRTQRFDFRRIPAEILEQHVSQIAKLEEIDIDQEALALVARHAEGSARDALSTLDQLSSFGTKITMAEAESLLGRRHEDAFFETFDAIAGGDIGAIFVSTQGFVARGADMRQLAFDALEHARTLLLLKAAPDAEGLLDVAENDKPRLLAQAEAFSGTTLLRTLDLIGKAIIEMRNAPNHRLLLEVALVRAAAPDTDPSASGLLGRLERLERRIGIDGAAPVPAAIDPPAVVSGSDTKSVSDSSTRRPPASKAPALPSTKKKVPAAPRAKGVAESGGRIAEESDAGFASDPEAATGGSVTSAAGSGGGSVSISLFRDSWDAVIKEASRASKRVGAYLNSSRPVSLDGDVLVVEAQSDFHAKSLGDVSNREMVAAAVFAALGVQPQLSFVERGKQNAPEPEVIEDAEVLEDSAQIEDAADPLEMLKKGLGAEVVEERKAGG